MSRKEKAIAYFDSLVGKFISRKFQVWIICTAAFWTPGMMNENNYIIVSCIYMGLETVIDLGLFTKYLKGRSSQDSPQHPPAEMPPPNI